MPADNTSQPQCNYLALHKVDRPGPVVMRPWDAEGRRLFFGVGQNEIGVRERLIEQSLFTKLLIPFV